MCMWFSFNILYLTKFPYRDGEKNVSFLNMKCVDSIIFTYQHSSKHYFHLIFYSLLVHVYMLFHATLLKVWQLRPFSDWHDKYPDLFNRIYTNQLKDKCMHMTSININYLSFYASHWFCLILQLKTFDIAQNLS